MNKKSRVGFSYTLEHLSVEGLTISSETIENIMPIEMVNYLLGTAFKGASAFTSWYLGVFGGNHTPVSNDTMTTLQADCEELTGYSGTTRQAIVFPAVVAGALTTLASPNILVFAAGATVRGAFITSGPSWFGTSGILVSEVLFPSPKVLALGEGLKLPLGFNLISL